eukprot:365906-Chlamydomonas_euryale.AAC.15
MAPTRAQRQQPSSSRRPGAAAAVQTLHVLRSLYVAVGCCMQGASGNSVPSRHSAAPLLQTPRLASRAWKQSLVGRRWTGRPALDWPNRVEMCSSALPWQGCTFLPSWALESCKECEDEAIRQLLATKDEGAHLSCCEMLIVQAAHSCTPGGSE